MLLISPGSAECRAGLAAGSLAGLLAASPAWAGPPLVTDDTGVLEPGQWEFILAAELDQRDELDVWLLPGFEANYGISDTTQFTAALGRVDIDPPAGKGKSDLGELTLEYKWRFHAGENTALAVVPAYTFPVNSSSTDRGIIDDLRVLSLPIVGSYATGNWEFNAQYTYELTSSGPDAAYYGLSGAYGISESLVVLGEVYNVTVLGESADETNFSLGLDYTFAPNWALLLAYRSSIDSDLDAVAELDSGLFLGVRYLTGG